MAHNGPPNWAYDVIMGGVALAERRISGPPPADNIHAGKGPYVLLPNFRVSTDVLNNNAISFATFAARVAADVGVHFTKRRGHWTKNDSGLGNMAGCVKFVMSRFTEAMDWTKNVNEVVDAEVYVLVSYNVS